MSVTLPLRNDLPHYQFECELDGATYSLEFAWNFRAQGWFLSIYDAAGGAVIQGLRVVVDFPIGARFKDSRMPPGVFQAMDTAGERRDPAFDDLGKRVLMLYFAASELA